MPEKCQVLYNCFMVEAVKCPKVTAMEFWTDCWMTN